jgi:RimJ/RimL family protein N-acetyltransferase
MPFEPIRTDRLVLRAPVEADTDAAYQRRNHPDVARYQTWALPYTREQATSSITASAALDGPTEGQWWNLTVVDTDSPDRILGDLAVKLSWEGRTGEIGFTFHPDNWGRGYATEAAQALVRHLFDDVGVHRVEGSLHPHNVASARVLEACGMLYEGQTRESFWVGDECSDNLLYGATRADWERWEQRPRHLPQSVDLVPITPDNRRAVGSLTVHKSQDRFVAPVLGSFRDALFPEPLDGEPVIPWYRAIEADGELAGFIMATEPTEAHPAPYLWRFLIDRTQQRRGVGSAALDRFEDWCRERGATEIEVSWIEGPGSPAPVYRARGFEPSGKIEHGEIHAVKKL